MPLLLSSNTSNDYCVTPLNDLAVLIVIDHIDHAS